MALCKCGHEGKMHQKIHVEFTCIECGCDMFENSESYCICGHSRSAHFDGWFEEKACLYGMDDLCSCEKYIDPERAKKKCPECYREGLNVCACPSECFFRGMTKER